MSAHRFYRPVWLALEPNRGDLASIEARDWPEGYIGVRRTAVRKIRFTVSIQVDGVWYRSRHYRTAEDAARAYNSILWPRRQAEPSPWPPYPGGGTAEAA